MKEELINGLYELAVNLIEATFTDSTIKEKEKFKKFTLKLNDKGYKTRLGSYNIRYAEIELSGLKEECRHDILITYLHEISHHIEMKRYGYTGHQKSFYNIHIKLLKKAIDLGLLDIKHITENNTSNASNKRKLAKYLQDYTPNKEVHISQFMDTSFLHEIEEDVKVNKTIQVKSIPENKDILKTNGYNWNSNKFVWEKFLEKKTDYNQEIEFLTKNDFLNIKIDGVAYFTQTIRVCITGNTYQYKEQLAALNYIYKNKKWVKTVSAKTINQELLKFRGMKNLKFHYEF